MTTLRTFQVFHPSTSRRPFISQVPQNEIDEHSREIAKQRAIQAVAEKEKENKKPPASKGKSKDEPPDPAAPDSSTPTTAGFLEIEEKFIVFNVLEHISICI
jgi:hypothetical protein